MQYHAAGGVLRAGMTLCLKFLELLASHVPIWLQIAAEVGGKEAVFSEK